MSDLNQAARDILRLNDKGGYTVPTEGLYPYQWNWDSAFAALGFAEFDIPRAWTELETLFSGQWPTGMVPHILFHQKDDRYFPGPDVWGCNGPLPSSGITQPPIAAAFARLIWEEDRAVGSERLRALLPKMLAWHRWFMDWRLDRGAVCVTHPWEAGRDNALDWDNALATIDPVGVGEYTRRDTAHVDPSMRPTKYDYDRYIWLVQLGRRLGWDDAKLLAENPFRVADPTMTFTLLRSARDLAAMCEELGVAADGIADDIAKLEAGAETLWNPELACYDSRDTASGKWSGAVSNAAFLCWYAGINRAEMRDQLRRINGLSTYPLPSLDPAHAKFDAKRYWRGPTWAIMNMMIGIGLADHHPELAEELRQTTRNLLKDQGFSEYYDPLTGAPAGGKSFTWTAAVWLIWAGKD